jgi:hypothetical protein
MQPPTLYKPIIIDVALFVKHKEVPTLNGMTIVPWKPTASALALQVFSALVELQMAYSQKVTDSQQQQQSSQDSSITSGLVFEFEASES